MDLQKRKISKKKVNNYINRKFFILKISVEEYMNDLNDIFKDKFIATHNVTNIEILLYKAKNDYYFSINDIFVDLIFLFKYINANLEMFLSENFRGDIGVFKCYLNNLYSKISQSIISNKKIFEYNLKLDMDYVLDQNPLPRKSIISFF